MMTPERVDEIVETIRVATFHMDDNEASKVIDSFLHCYPELLEAHDKQWYYENC